MLGPIARWGGWGRTVTTRSRTAFRFAALMSRISLGRRLKTESQQSLAHCHGGWCLHPCVLRPPSRELSQGQARLFFKTFAEEVQIPHRETA